ncbi:MAG: TrmH family RNA methyltransferase [Kineosporiaceae bacterium]
MTEPGSGRIGVGPWPGGPDAWPADPRFDPDLLRDGDSRNVVDAYRYWTVEAVRTDLATRALPFHVAVENLGRDLNIGSVVRTANAFNAAAVHVVGRRRWNRRGAMVTDRYLDVRHHEDAAALAAWARGEGLGVLGVDNVPGATPLETYDLPERVVLLFGEEGPGLTPQALAVSDAVLAITQFGSTRSLNVGAAAGIAVHAWVRRWVFGQRPGDTGAPQAAQA